MIRVTRFEGSCSIVVDQLTAEYLWGMMIVLAGDEKVAYSTRAVAQKVADELQPVAFSRAVRAA